MNNNENAILHFADISRDVKNFIFHEWNEKLNDDQKFDVMIQAIEMQNDVYREGEN